ncbi:GrpB family protein [Nocardia sp. NPDC059239]|uniref:GrpB family protein n=1 Tax=Nocardia sp. NPDC059239 TaxID=3346785 RepID=UPI00368AB536
MREPSFHEHRCLRLADPRVNLHVFGPNCPETVRMRMFRDWMRGQSRRSRAIRRHQTSGDPRRRQRHGLQRTQAASDPRDP